jgi:hypothetical protein
MHETPEARTSPPTNVAEGGAFLRRSAYTPAVTMAMDAAMSNAPISSSDERLRTASEIDPENLIMGF